MALLDAHPIGDQEVMSLIPPGLATFVETDHEIFSKVFLALLLIQEGQLTVSG